MTTETRQASRMARVIFGVATTALIATHGPAVAQVNQSCGMLAASGCTMLQSAPPWSQHPNTVVREAWSHYACHTGCAVTKTNAGLCEILASTLRAEFTIASDTSAMGCDFNCGAKGKCSIRGGDGLPVELMHFGVE